MEEIMVSICCSAYNHEKYIRQCLDGFLMQKCNFKFEVLIHDDASTDNTANIIREYEAKYPDIVKPIYQTENKYSKGEKVSKYNILRAKGKYIAFCEGDDFWIHPEKLQLQTDALERNPKCKFSVHRVQTVLENGEKNKKIYPSEEYQIDSGVLTDKQFLAIECSERYSFQTSSYLCLTNVIRELYENPPEFRRVANTGDICIMLFMANHGDIYYFKEIMSCYRIGSISSNERTKQYQGSEDSLLKYTLPRFQMLKEFDEYSHHKYHKLCVKKERAYRFFVAYDYKNYREMIKPKYRFFMKRFPIKARIKMYLTAFFPKLISRYDERRTV